MMVRLAFSVQAQIDPDILIVDEALSVGDAKFQAKCFDRLKQLKENGTSILLVTHSSEQIVTHCDKAILLDKGIALEQGDPKNVVNRYYDVLFGKDKTPKISAASPRKKEKIEEKNTHQLSTQEDLFSSRPGFNPYEYRWGDRAAEIIDFHTECGGISYPTSIKTGQTFSIELAVRFIDRLVNPIFGLTLKTKEGITLYGSNTELLSSLGMREVGNDGTTVLIAARFIANLGPGDYFLSLGIATRHGDAITPHDRRYDSIHFTVEPPEPFFGLVQLDLSIDQITQLQQ